MKWKKILNGIALSFGAIYIVGGLMLSMVGLHNIDNAQNLIRFNRILIAEGINDTLVETTIGGNYYTEDEAYSSGFHLAVIGVWVSFVGGLCFMTSKTSQRRNSG